MAAVGGNLLQRTRCGYFADTSQPCNRRAPGSGCPAIAEEHHDHAVLGLTDHRAATHPSDLAVALTAFDAVVGYKTLYAATAIRTRLTAVPVDTLPPFSMRGPGATPGSAGPTATTGRGPGAKAVRWSGP